MAAALSCLPCTRNCSSIAHATQAVVIIKINTCFGGGSHHSTPPPVVLHSDAISLSRLLSELSIGKCCSLFLLAVADGISICSPNTLGTHANLQLCMCVCSAVHHRCLPPPTTTANELSAVPTVASATNGEAAV